MLPGGLQWPASGHCSRCYLEAFDGQLQDVWRELGGLLEGEVAPVDDEDKAVDLELRVLDQYL